MEKKLDTHIEVVSSCCGAGYDKENGICLECKEPCDGIKEEYTTLIINNE